jgi:cellulose synthase/poly-beta-1,6-N-acetylglucosamine synthase-like glycosyltransferase
MHITGGMALTTQEVTEPVPLYGQDDELGQPYGRLPKIRRPAIRDIRLPGPQLQHLALTLAIALIGVTAFLAALSSGSAAHFVVSVLLAAAIWRISFALLGARARRESLATVNDRRVAVGLLLAVVACLLWFAWTRPGAWWCTLGLAAAVILATWKPGWRTAQDRVHKTAWPTIGLLLLLNILVMAALLAAAKLSWTAHTKIAFIVLFYVDAQLMKGATASSWRAAEQASSQSYSFSPEVIKPQKPKSADKIHKLAAAALVTALIGWIGYAHPGPLLVLGVLVVGAAMLSTVEVSRHQAITMLLAIGTAVAAVDYISWRFAATNWQGWWVAVPLLFAEVLGAVHTVGFQATIWPWPTPVLEATEDPSENAIFLLIPTVNEGVATLRPTLDACIAARQRYLAQHPAGQVTIVVCNDGRVGNYPRWAEIETLARELDVRCVTRTEGGGAKAGNIEHARQALQITGKSLLVVFDADQVPTSDFLLKAVPPFADAAVGWVQTGQYNANLNNPVSRWADDQQSMFYNLLCPGKAALDAAFICGTNVVIRGAALDEIGGFPQDSVTEDFAASIALAPRWRSIYLTDVLATGLGPLDIPSYLKQQGRWSLGTMGVLRTHWRDLLLPRKNGLRPAQRVQYLLACTHYLSGVRDLIYLIGPVLFIITGIPALRTATLSQYLAHFLPYCALGILSLWYSAQGVTGLRGVIIGFASAPALIGSVVAVILNRKKPFAITSKELSGRQSLKYLRVYWLLLLMCVAALVWATQINGRQEASLFISMLWIVYSMVLLTSFLWLALEDTRVRRRAAAHVMGKQVYPSKLLLRKNSLRPVLNLGLAALLAVPVLLDTRLATLPVFTSAATPFVITRQQVAAEYAGVSLPVQLLSSQSTALEHELNAHFSVIGRTQIITDQFDTAWANQLAAQGARPWIDLDFGDFGADHKPTLTADLPAIVNGVDDSAISRWAAEIRKFDKPVYLTVLLQADKNWSVSSGVANGGIPEDVSRAWMHIQSVFRAAGADNVAWVWAPADPLHDQQFAPRPAAIDAVLQDFINYPGTKWSDPVKALRSLARRYPGKPLFIEVSASGPAAEKSAWFRRLGQAVAQTPQVYTLLYLQGGPQSNPSPAQQRSWSVASDPRSLAAWKDVVSGLHGGGAARGNLRRAAGSRRR